MSNYPLFFVIGLEIEYMVVDKTTLNVCPVSDIILQELAQGKLSNEVELGETAVSNELVMHVIEVKNNGPKPLSRAIVDQFQGTLEQLQQVLEPHGWQLLPTGAHPWMDPATETQRWPHGNREIYQQYDAIFNCEGHGFANLQSMHVNLPFANDEEFNLLHNAIRLLLPLIPALAASTPFLDGRYTGMQDSRLHYYNQNQQAIKAISGEVIPEFVRSQAHYQQHILTPMYEAIKPFDRQGILQHEWLNSRAAIAKFEYGAIEIRIIDSQECVSADYAIACAIVAILRYWINHSHYFIDHPCDNAPLVDLYQQSIHHGLLAVPNGRGMLEQWQIKSAKNCRDVWSQLLEKVGTEIDHSSQLMLQTMLAQGNLSQRIVNACGSDFSHRNLTRIYRQLGHCLMNNHQLQVS